MYCRPEQHKANHNNNTGSLNLAVLGDSLTTGFHVSSPLSMIYQTRTKFDSNWCVANVGEIQSIAERCSYLGNTSVLNLSRTSARVYESSKNEWIDWIIGVQHLASQVTRLIQLERFPDLTLIWIGHNNLDWANFPQTTKIKKLSTVKNILIDRFIQAYRQQLEKIMVAAARTSESKTIIVFGLVNFEFFFTARKEIERFKKENYSRYPYLEQNYIYFSSMKPQYRDGMIELAQCYNRAIKTLIKELHPPINSHLTLKYSDAMTRVDISHPKALSAYDAWHPSKHGHKLFAASAFKMIKPVIQDYFLQTNSTQ